MKEGDVVLTAFEQTDGKAKNRPAIVLRVMRPFGDLLICGISRQLRHRVADFDEIYRSGGLRFRVERFDEHIAYSPGFSRAATRR